MDLVERKYVSRYSSVTFALLVNLGGVPGDADGPVTYSLRPAESAEVSWTRDATRTDLGLYEAVVTSADTAVQGYYAIEWAYQVNGLPEIYVLDFEVGPTAPAYDALSLPWRTVIENVWIKFADLYDSPMGGPNLQVYMSTHFGRNRLAQLLRTALQRLNSASSPHKSFPHGGIDFPFEEWGGLLEQSLYMEVLKHLIRSYTEQPEAILGTSVSRLDRRDYMNRWQQIFDMEQREFERDLSRYRQSQMGLGNFSVLVAGGAYGNFGPSINPGGAGAALARGYYPVHRWH